MHETALIMSLKSHSLSVPLAFSRASICFIGASLFAFLHREPSLWFASITTYCQTYNQGVISPSQPHCMLHERRILDRWKQGAFSRMWLSEEMYTNAARCSEAFLFTLTPRECCSLMLLRHVFFFPGYCIKCWCEPCLPFAFEDAL